MPLGLGVRHGNRLRYAMFTHFFAALLFQEHHVFSQKDHGRYHGRLCYCRA